MDPIENSFLTFHLVLLGIKIRALKSSTLKSHLGILLPKLFGSTVRKNCTSDREKLLLNSRLKAENLQKF